MREIWHAVRYGKWSFGCEQWPGKPQFEFYHTYYDGNWAVLHFGPFYIDCHY